MSTSPRIYFLDNLRAWVVLLVVVLHGSMSYMAYAPPWWYVLDTQNSLLFTLLVLVVDVPIMLIMFFVAGYFALPSLVRRGAAGFLREKFLRIGAPWLFGALFLAPPIAFMTYFSRQSPMGLFEFWRTDFWTVMYQQSVYWFLGILFLFFGALAAFGPGPESGETEPVLPSNRFLWTFWGLMTLGFLLLNQIFPLDTWFTKAYIFVFQPNRVPLYVGYFWLGLYAYRHKWFTPGGYLPRLWPWVIVWALSGLLYLGYRLTIPAPVQTTLLLKAGNAILFNTFCFSSLLAGAAFFQRRVNGRGWFWRSQAANSYGIYYLHPLILFPLVYLFVGISMPVMLKAVVVILLAILLSWAASALILKKVPGLRRIF